MNWVIGDVHGMLEPLDTLLLEIRNRDSNPTIYCVGDLCDRGPDTKGVVERVIKDGIKCVRGNHDDVFDCILSGKPTATTDDQTIEAPLSSLHWFLQFGMRDTLKSYGIVGDEVRECFNGLSHLERIVARIPEEHHKFFNSLPLMIEGDGFFVAHAALVPELALGDALSENIYQKAMIWGRFTEEQIKEDKVWGKIGYFGHTPTYKYGAEYHGKPVFGNGLVLLDTGAVFGKGLTVICHETKEVITV